MQKNKLEEVEMEQTKVPTILTNYKIMVYAKNGHYTTVTSAVKGSKTNIQWMFISVPILEKNLLPAPYVERASDKRPIWQSIIRPIWHRKLLIPMAFPSQDQIKADTAVQSLRDWACCDNHKICNLKYSINCCSIKIQLQK